MKKGAVLLIFAASLISCVDSGSIDRNYLESGDYREFEQKSQLEATGKSSNFVSFLQQIGDCGQTKTDFPIIINREKIAALVKASDENCEQGAEYRGMKMQLLKEVQLPDYSLKWVLLNEKSVYENRRLLAVTFRHDSLIAFREAGIFQNNLSKDVSTKIRVTKKAEKLFIESEINRKIIYPFEQESVINQQFIINSNGIIE